MHGKMQTATNYENKISRSMGEKNDSSVKVVDPSRRRDCEAHEK